MKSRPLEDLALIMDDRDNVAVAKVPISKQTVIAHGRNALVVLEDIPKGHRFALTDVRNGVLVVQYGYPFGVSCGIEKGQRVHKHNVLEYRPDYSSAAISAPLPGRERRVMPSERTFQGYLRADGRAGTRNYFVVLPTSLCASDTAVRIARSIHEHDQIRTDFPRVDGIVAAGHTEGCGCNDGEIIERLLRVLKNTVLHPNVGGALVVDLGCEKTNHAVVKRYLGSMDDRGKPVKYLSIIASGGTQSSLDLGKRIVCAELPQVNSAQRTNCPLSKLVLGTECGASDTFSGITANPVIGAATDSLIAAGGSAILSETTEMLGAETALIGRMVSHDVARKFTEGIEEYRSLADKLGVSIEGNFVPGNEHGGLVNLVLKSLGAILKGGTSPIVDFLDYGQPVARQGLSIMNGPGNDLESITGIVASGANIILFSTGMGTPEGALIAPTIKVSSTTDVYVTLSQDIDFNAGRLLDTNTTVENLGQELIALAIEVANGRKTWSEKWDKHSFQIWSAGKLSL